MNRQQRRFQRKSFNKNDFKNEVYKDISERLEKQIQETISQERWANIEAQYRILGYMLNKEFGFGQQRILKAYQAMDRIVGELNEGILTADDLDEFMKKTGIEIEFN